MSDVLQDLKGLYTSRRVAQSTKEARIIKAAIAEIEASRNRDVGGNGGSHGHSVTKLRETIADYRSAAIAHVSMEGTHYRGVSNSVFRHAWEADIATNGYWLAGENVGQAPEIEK